MAKEKMSNLNIAIIVAIGLMLVYAFVPGVSDYFKGEKSTGTQTSPATSGGCEIEDITFTPKMTRLGKAGTALTGASENYYIITDNLGSTNGGSTITVPTNYDMQIMFGEASSTYYTVVKTVDTECSDPKYESVQLPMVDTSLNSFYLENSDGSVNSATNNETMAADDRFETTVTIKAGTDTYFGNPFSDCKNVGVIEYNKTSFKIAEGDNPTAVPGSFNYSGATWDGSNAFYIPKTADGVEAKFNVAIETVSTLPSKFALHSLTNQPRIHLYDCDIDKNEDTLDLIEGVEDEDLNSIALGHHSKYIYVGS